MIFQRKMSNKYFIRLDDACPYMDAKKWQLMEDILDKYGVRPLVGIIPANADPKTMIDPEDPLFWDKAHRWKDKGWEIALHGYDHVCVSEGGMKGLNPMWKRSEFAGLPLEIQREKIKKGYAILESNGLLPKYFFAPSHTFDENTLEALYQESDIRVISDTIALRPYKKKQFYYIPQITGHCVKMPLIGTFTFCFHPNTMKDGDFNSLENFIIDNKASFIPFSGLNYTQVGSKRLIDRVLSICFFSFRKLRGLK